MVDGTAHGSIGPNDSVAVEGVDPGSHAVELADIEFNCATVGPFTRTVSLGSDAGAVVDYSLACDAPSRSRIVFLKYWPYSNAEVTLMNADGSDLVNLDRQPRDGQAGDTPPARGRLVARRQSGGLHALGWRALRDDG